MAIQNKTKIAVNYAFTNAQNLSQNSFEEKQYGLSHDGSRRTLSKAKHEKPSKQHEVYSVSFSDGSKINVTDNTFFKLSSASERMFEEDGEYESNYLDIKQILSTPEEKWAYPLETIFKGEPNPHSSLIPPYVLGLWAAGIIRDNEVTSKLSDECREELEERGFHLYEILGQYDITSFMLPKYLPLLGIKTHAIPSSYIFSPVEDRIELLKGITAHSNKSHSATITLITQNLHLISNIRTLLASLGASSRIKVSHQAEHTVYFTITFQKNFDDLHKELEWNRISKIERTDNIGDYVNIKLSNKSKDLVIGETFIPILLP